MTSKPAAPEATDEQIESAIEESGGHWVDDEFRINGKDLMGFARALLSASNPAAPSTGEPVACTDAQIEAITYDEYAKRQGHESDFDCILKVVKRCLGVTSKPTVAQCSGCTAFDSNASEVHFVQGCEGCTARMQKIAGFGPNEAALAAIHEFLGIAQKKIYPQPDKPQSDWAKLKSAVDGLALLVSMQQSAAVLDDERAALLSDYIELNMSNYGPDDVDKLNAWAIDAYGFISRAASPQVNSWKVAVDNELVTIGSTADSFPSAHEALKALLDWHVSVALDPAVSREAQALIDSGASQATATQPAQTEAAAFEVWASGNGLNPKMYTSKLNPGGAYGWAMKAWQARALLTAAQPAQKRRVEASKSQGSQSHDYP